MNRVTHDLVISNGEYKDRQTGQMKKRWLTIGRVFTDTETGRQSFKLDVVPVGPDWSGFGNIFPIKDQAQAPRAPQPPPRDETAGWDSNQPADDIPF